MNCHRMVLALAFAGPILAGAEAQEDKKTATLKPVMLETVKAHDRDVAAIAVSADGKWVATAGVDRPDMTHTVKLWKTIKTPTHTLKGFDRPATALDFTPDGSSLLVGGYDPEAKTGTIKIYDVATGKLHKTLTVGNQPVQRFALLDIGRSFVAGASVNELKVWNVASGESGQAIKLQPYASASALATSADGKHVAVGLFGSKVGHLAVYDLKSGKELFRSEEKPGVNMIQAVAYAPDGKTIATSSVGFTKPGEVRLYEASTGKLLGSLGAQRSFSAAFSPDGKLLATGESPGFGRREPGAVNLFDVAAQKSLAALKGHQDGVSRVAFSPDGRHLYSGSSDGALIVWRLR